MSMWLDFEPHSWYMFFAIQDNRSLTLEYDDGRLNPYQWIAYTDDGDTYRIVKLEAQSLESLKELIRDYWKRDGGKNMPWTLERHLKEKKNA